jgi:hypothetical protein
MRATRMMTQQCMKNDETYSPGIMRGTSGTEKDRELGNGCVLSNATYL